MNNLGPDIATEPLLFSWDSSRTQKAALLAFLALSLLAHAVCFYVFQVVYPPIVTLLPPPARVVLITPASEEGRTLLRRIDAEDPAVAFTTHRPPEAKLRALPRVEHVPSYHAIEPTLKELPRFEVDSRAPESQPPGPVPLKRQQSAPAAGVLSTSVSFSSELEAFGVATLPPLKFDASTAETPEAIQFRVAVSRLGEVRFCFPMNSSGDPALDAQARLYLARCRFFKNAPDGGKPDTPLTWGIAIIEWGSDITRPQGRQPSSTTP
jgi:outer membrane biosynthesis protein TonB